MNANLRWLWVKDGRVLLYEAGEDLIS